MSSSMGIRYPTHRINIRRLTQFNEVELASSDVSIFIEPFGSVDVKTRIEIFTQFWLLGQPGI